LNAADFWLEKRARFFGVDYRLILLAKNSGK